MLMIYLSVALLVMFILAVHAVKSNKLIEGIDQFFIVLIGAAWPIVLVALIIHFSANFFHRNYD